MTAPGSCGGHGGLPPELRALALLALDRLEPAVERLRDLPADAPARGAAVCASCPLCAVLSVLRGERPEMAARLAEHATGLLTLLRTALLTTPTPSTDPPTGRGEAPEQTPASRSARPGESCVSTGRVDGSGRSTVPGEHDGRPAFHGGDPAGGEPGSDEARAGDRPGVRSAAAPQTPDGRPPGHGGRTVQRIPVTR
jgi:hypothetical protein